MIGKRANLSGINVQTDPSGAASKVQADIADLFRHKPSRLDPMNALRYE